MANGGILLEYGHVDEAWYQESLQLAEQAAEQLRLAAVLLEKAQSRFFLYITQQLLGVRRHKGNLPALIAFHSLLIGTDIPPLYCLLPVRCLTASMSVTMGWRFSKASMKTPVL